MAVIFFFLVHFFPCNPSAIEELLFSYRARQFSFQYLTNVYCKKYVLFFTFRLSNNVFSLVL